MQHGELQRCCSDFCMTFVENRQAAVWKDEKIALNIKNDKNCLTNQSKGDNIIKLSDEDEKRVQKSRKTFKKALDNLKSM